MVPLQILAPSLVFHSHLSEWESLIILIIYMLHVFPFDSERIWVRTVYMLLRERYGIGKCYAFHKMLPLLLT